MNNPTCSTLGCTHAPMAEPIGFEYSEDENNYQPYFTDMCEQCFDELDGQAKDEIFDTAYHTGLRMEEELLNLMAIETDGLDRLELEIHKTELYNVGMYDAKAKALTFEEFWPNVMAHLFIEDDEVAQMREVSLYEVTEYGVTNITDDGPSEVLFDTDCVEYFEVTGAHHNLILAARYVQEINLPHIPLDVKNFIRAFERD